MIRTIFMLSLLFPAIAHAQAPVTQTPPVAPVQAPPVVVELFTSQGCAFCPPADALMGQMIKQPGIIGLSCHVDYFGVRKNNLGKGFCTKRQNDYNRTIASGPRYTPQLVVNGASHVIGHEVGKVSAAILKARSQKILPIALTAAGEGGYSFSLPQATLDGPARILMAVYDSPKTLTITEGGNFGKKVNYYNVVSRLEELGTWDGASMMRAITANYGPDNGGIAILAQDVRTGQIVAAGQAAR